jgi:hypothetical protein
MTLKAYAECYIKSEYTERRYSSLTIVMLNVIMLSVVILNVVILNVVGPPEHLFSLKYLLFKEAYQKRNLKISLGQTIVQPYKSLYICAIS